MPVKFLADENFKASIIRGFLRQQPELDIVSIQDINLRGADDPIVLEWAAREKRILLSHDVNTMTKHFYERLTLGLPVSGVVAVKQDAPIGQVIHDILLLSEFEEECWEQIRYVPL